MIGSEKET